MTTTEHLGGTTPPPPPPPPTGGQPQRVLRRSREDRIAAGVSGGLGEYFRVDPVLFRVLFATAAFFGGAGVLAYLIAWAVVPEAGTVNAPIDRFVAGLRRRRVPVWLVVAAAGIFFWAIAFSWWAPGHFVPLWILVIVLVAIFARRGRRHDDPVAVSPSASVADTVSLDKDTASTPTTATSTQPTWMDETRGWIAESKNARRERRMRAFPIRIGALVALVVTIAILAAVDAASGIALPVYPWVTFGIVTVALLAGLVLRRTPWSLTVLLVPAVIGMVAFGGTAASLHDGSGERDWTPTTTSELKSEYRLAFGQGTLDLSHLPSLTASRTVDITMGSGQVRIFLPSQMNTKIVASVHLGHVIVDNDEHSDSGGFGVNRTILPNQGATGAPLTVNVHLADGEVAVEHRG